MVHCIYDPCRSSFWRPRRVLLWCSWVIQPRVNGPWRTLATVSFLGANCSWPSPSRLIYRMCTIHTSFATGHPHLWTSWAAETTALLIQKLLLRTVSLPQISLSLFDLHWAPYWNFKWKFFLDSLFLGINPPYKCLHYFNAPANLNEEQISQVSAWIFMLIQYDQLMPLIQPPYSFQLFLDNGAKPPAKIKVFPARSEYNVQLLSLKIHAHSVDSCWVGLRHFLPRWEVIYGSFGMGQQIRRCWGSCAV